ncbi:MAG: carboxypeptidase regulatory-like domain-containing protein [Cytophagaceae bacterium]|nr:carboxypeptidase regulatory-like domain-containing protein [Gemmatimonadaceae bacterium]
MLVSRRSARRRFSFTTAALGLSLALVACGREASVGPVRPELPDNPPIPPQYRGAAFIMDVSSLKKTVRITPPQGTIRTPISTGNIVSDFARGIPNRLGIPTDSISTFSSLLGGDVIDLVATNYVAGALGAVQPNKILITFDLQINNKLNGVDLILPTWPTPPAGAAGPLLFPFEIGVTTTSGGVSVGGAGNEVIVTSPRGGAVTVSTDWNGNGTPGSGAPHNFFNDVGCTATANDCFRYEEYGPIAALGSSTSRTVGFLIDPTVGDFRVKMIVAADLRNAGGPAQFGTVAGSVTSPQIGNIANASVSVSGGFSGTTIANGSYSISNVGVGSRTVSVSNLPAGCTLPASQSVTVTNGGTATANFSVVCTVPTGSVAGTITSSLGGGITGVAVVATPTGGSPTSPFTTGGTGAYTLTVPVGPGTGAITLSNLPANCTNPGATNYSGLTSGGTVTLNVTVTCTAPPQVGTVQGTITSSLGGGIAGASVVVTPTGGPALAGVTTNAQGLFSNASVPVGAGTGTVSLSALPNGCTAPAPSNYSGLTNGGTVTVNITVTCVAAAFTYPFSATWGPITNTGPTGRQVQITFQIDMGAAPGNPAINGSAADELVGADWTFQFNGAALAYQSRTIIGGANGNLDLVGVGNPQAGLTNIAQTSSQSLTESGVVQLVRVTYNITAGFSGAITPTLTLNQVSAGIFLSPTNVTANVTLVTLPTLTVP